MSTADPNRVILTGENPFIRLSHKDGDPNSTDASYWRILFSDAGPGHVLYLKSELTENRWRIYTDNIAMTRWLQKTVQGMLNAELKDTSIPVTGATFSKSRRLQGFLDRERARAGRGNRFDLARHRRSPLDPHATQQPAGAPLRRLYRAGAGAWYAPHFERPGSRRANPGRGNARAAPSAPPRSPSRKAGRRSGDGFSAIEEALKPTVDKTHRRHLASRPNPAQSGANKTRNGGTDMAYGLDEFVRDIKTTLKADSGPGGRMIIKTRMEELLKNQEFLAKALPPEFA